MSTQALAKIDTDNRTHSELIQLVSFMLADEEYGVEVLKVREIIRMPAITKMPNTPPMLRGLLTCAGKSSRLFQCGAVLVSLRVNTIAVPASWSWMWLAD